MITTASRCEPVIYLWYCSVLCWNLKGIKWGTSSKPAIARIRYADVGLPSYGREIPKRFGYMRAASMCQRARKRREIRGSNWQGNKLNSFLLSNEASLKCVLMNFSAISCPLFALRDSSAVRCILAVLGEGTHFHFLEQVNALLKRFLQVAKLHGKVKCFFSFLFFFSIIWCSKYNYFFF